MIRVVSHAERILSNLIISVILLDNFAFAAVYYWKENKIRRNDCDILYYTTALTQCPYGEYYPLGLIQEDNCIHRDRPLSILLKSISSNFKYFVSYSSTEYAAKYGQLIRLYDDCYSDRLE